MGYGEKFMGIRPSRGASELRGLRLNPIAAGVMAFLLASGNAYAQATPQTEEEKEAAEAAAKGKANEQPVELGTVNVTGIRRGIENAIDTKQSATSIVESVSAEDIGKLPDSSIAESIARLPGLTAQRERGRATQIQIRGFAGDFAGTTLNGREQVSTGDNRGVEFDQYPSELLQSVVVYKTPDATLVGQGLSGTVDLQSTRPLSFSDRVLSVNYRYDTNEIENLEEHGNRYSFSYIDQFMDGKLGLALGYAHLDSPQPGFQNEAWGYAGTPNGSVLGGGKIYKFDNNNERDGYMATVQFKPNDFYEGTIDLFYSKFVKTELKSGVEFGTAFGSGILVDSGPPNGNGTITDSDWINVRPVLRADSNPIRDRLRSYGFNNQFHINENLDVDVDWSMSKIHRDFRVLETYAGLASGTTDLQVRLNEGGYYDFFFGTDLNDPANLRLVDAGGWGQDGYLKDFEVEDRLHALRIDATRSFDDGWLSSIEFGANRTDREKEKSSLEYKLCIIACAGGDTAPFPGSPSEFGFFGLDGYATFDAESLLDFYNLQAKFHKDIAGKNWGVDESLTTFYAQANIDTDWGSVPVRGNFGFQWVDTDQSTSGFHTFRGNDAGDPVHAGTSFHEFLPSMNLSFQFPHDQYLRVALARQMARPRMDDLRATFNVDVTQGAYSDPLNPGPLNPRNQGGGDCRGQHGVPIAGDPNGTTAIWCGNAGNPDLKPWLANAFDLSYEWYFSTEAGNRGYLSAAYFYKDLQTYLYKQNFAYDFSGLPLPPPEPTDLGPEDYPVSTVGVLEQVVNGEGGKMHGLELTLSVPLDILWKRLEGFGIQASYSDTTSQIHPNRPGTSEPLPGLSRYVSNITAYYERQGFSIRYSRRTRSAFRAESRGFGADLTFENFGAEVVQDAQVNYDFQHGWAKGLSLYLQVSNIGDEPFTTFDTADPDGRPLKYFEYGRTTLIGFSYKFQ
jgi:iron complex outermembrane recepter protein